jgi:hypothetical protein
MLRDGNVVTILARMSVPVPPSTFSSFHSGVVMTETITGEQRGSARGQGIAGLWIWNWSKFEWEERLLPFQVQYTLRGNPNVLFGTLNWYQLQQVDCDAPSFQFASCAVRAEPVPTLQTWGLAVLGILFMSSGVVATGRAVRRGSNVS